MKLSAHKNGFTLTEVIISQAIAGLVFAGVLAGFVQSSTRAEWSAYSLAAQSLAMERLEQARAAKWDPLAYPPVDKLVATNFPVMVSIMDIPVVGTNFSYATNITLIKEISVYPPLKHIQVSCVWAFVSAGKRKLFTNTVAVMRGPDQ